MKELKGHIYHKKESGNAPGAPSQDAVAQGGVTLWGRSLTCHC